LRRKLILLDLALIGLIALAVMQLRKDQDAARAREAVMLSATLPPAPALNQPVPAPGAPKPASEFLQIAQKLLFSKDRNPDVIVEVEKPKPMPPLPKYYGEMNFGSGPTVLLRGEKDERQRGYRLGETIGEFKLVAINQQDIFFEWDGKPVKSTLAALRPVENRDAPSARRNDVRGVEAPKPVAPKRVAPVVQGRPDKGDPADEARGCVDGDKSPAGTVSEGYRKVITRTPFSAVCRWMKVN
jgi:hypothetical protein